MKIKGKRWLRMTRRLALRKYSLDKIHSKSTIKIQKEKLLMKEDLVTNFLSYLNNVAQKGRLKQLRQDVAKENPKMAKKLEDFEKQRDIVNKISSRYC